MKKRLIIILGAVVVVIAGVTVFATKHRTPDEVAPSVSATPEKSHGYNNSYMSVDVAAGWKATDAGSGAVNITKGNWILYINPAATQASGVEGGRFDEYAAGAPGVELVMGDMPRPRNGYECGLASTTRGAAVIQGTSVTRHDFYTTPGALAGCHVPSEAPAAWFLSIVGARAGFNDVSSVTDAKVVAAPNGFPVRQFAITMTYKAPTVDALPKKFSSDLNLAVRDMDAMVSTIVFH